MYFNKLSWRLEVGAPDTFKFFDAHGAFTKQPAMCFYIRVNLVNNLMSSMAKYIYIGLQFMSTCNPISKRRALEAVVVRPSIDVVNM